MKVPLCLYVIKHPDFSSGLEYAQNFYSDIDRDIDHQTIKKSSVTVFYTDSNDNLDNQLDIDYQIAQKTAILVFVDNNIALDRDYGWKQYLIKLYNLQKNNKDIRVFFVAVQKPVLSINEFKDNISNSNFIRLYEKDENVQYPYLIMRVRHELCRMLFGLEKASEADIELDRTEHAARLFLSHTKSDGLEVTKKVRDFINTETGISDFFDAVDIPAGKPFDKEIEQSICNSNLLLIFQSDAYSLSEWCKKEVFAAKKHDIPLLIVNCLQSGESRSFPYLGNAKSIRVDREDPNLGLKIISSAMEELLSKESYRQTLMLHPYQSNIKSKKGLIRASAPELLTVDYSEDEQHVIIYPEPPLGQAENELLTKKFKNVKLMTPTVLYSQIENLNLNNKKIAISVSECDTEHKRGITNYHCHAFVTDLSLYLLNYGAELIYGGDLTYPDNRNFTNTIIEAVRNYSKDYGRCKKLKNYMAGYIAESFSEDMLLEQDNPIYNEVSIMRMPKSPDGNMASDLTIMRNMMAEDMDILVVAGGKLRDFSGKCQGILEEFVFAVEKQKPVYLLGGFGGISKRISDAIEKRDTYFASEEFKKDLATSKNLNDTNAETHYKQIVSLMSSIDYKSLNNGLSEQDNMLLFKSINYSEIIALILKGIEYKG